MCRRTTGIVLTGLIIACCSCVVSLWAQTPDSLVGEGKNALFESGDPALAKSKFDAAIALDENHTAARYWRAVVSVYKTADLLSDFEAKSNLYEQDETIIFDTYTLAELNGALDDLSYIYIDGQEPKHEVWLASVNEYGINNGIGWVKQAMRVVPDSSYATDRITLHLARTGNPAGNVTLKLCASAPDTLTPDETTVLASTSIPCSQPGTSFDWVLFTFDSPVNLSAGTVYWLVVETDYTPSGTDYVALNAPGGVPGNWSYYNGSAWQPYSNFAAWGMCQIFEYQPGGRSFTDTFQTDNDGEMFTADYGDVAAMRATVLRLLMCYHIGQAYGVTNKVVQEIIDMEHFDFDDFIAAYQNVLNLSGTAGTSLSNAKNALLSMIDAYIVQSDFIRNNRNDDGGIHYFVRFYNSYNPNYFSTVELWQRHKSKRLYSEQQHRQFLQDVKSNLLDQLPSVGMEFPDNEGAPDLQDEHQWDFSAFFDTQINFNFFMSQFLAFTVGDGKYIRGDFYYSTINGLLPQFTVADWNHLKNGGSAFTVVQIEWENDSPSFIVPQWQQPDAGFMQYKLFRSTTPEVDDASHLVTTTSTHVWHEDKTIDLAQDVYYYRIYTYYNFSGVTTPTYNEKERAFIRAYISAGNADDLQQDGSKTHPYSDFTPTVEDKVNVGTLVCVAEGTYYGTSISTYIFHHNLRLYGGYDPVSWVRDIDVHETILNASGLQGALHIYAVQGVVIDGFTVIGGEHASNNGITMNSAGSSVTGNNTIRNCKISGVLSTGIGVWNAQGSTVENCTVSDCGNYGIQVYASEAVNIENCSTVSNGQYGLFITQGANVVFVEQFTATDNTLHGVNISSSSSVYLDRCIIGDNSATGVTINYTGAIVTNSLITNNGSDGVACINGGLGYIFNNTIVGNGGNGGVSYTDNTSGMRINNNIIVGNNGGTGQHGIHGATTTASINITYNNAYNNTGGDYYNCGTQAGSNGNISADPLFYNPDSVIHPIYRLSFNSPCIDTADNDSYLLTSPDLDEAQRIVNGIIDMGAYEYHDTDNDGLPNFWEDRHGLNPNVNDADTDPDNDGKTNHDEYLTDSDPQVWNADLPEIQTISAAGLSGRFDVTFKLIDVQDDICSIDVQYSNDAGTWLDATVVGDTTDLTSNRFVDLVWDTEIDIPNASGESYYLRFRATDATGSGDWAEFGPFQVLNVPHLAVDNCISRLYAFPGDVVTLSIKMRNISDSDYTVIPEVKFSYSGGSFLRTASSTKEVKAHEPKTGRFDFTTPGYAGVYTMHIRLYDYSSGNIKAVSSDTYPLILDDQDTDNDGMPDGWEQYAGTDPNADDDELDHDNDALTNYGEFYFGCDPYEDDTDNDGQKDSHEYVATTDPLDPESVFKIVASGNTLDIGPDGVIDTLTWTFEASRVYRIHWTDSLSTTNWYVVNYSGWQDDIQENDDGTKTWTYNGQDSLINQYARYFRVVLDSE